MPAFHSSTMNPIPKVRPIDSPEAMIAAIRYFGVLPFFRCGIPGWSVEELTAPGCWFSEEEDTFLGPWDWKIDAVREGDIAYGKFLGGKAAFATVTWYRELMNWRRSQPRWRMALGERCKAVTQSDKLMKVLAPLALAAIQEAGALEMRELRIICARKLTPAQLKALGARYRPMLTPAVKKSIMDSVIQFLQMGTWTVIGDFERVYRGPELTYRGWQRASNTTPDELFGSLEPAAGQAAVPAWARRFEEATTAPLPQERSPEESRERIINHIIAFFPQADRKALAKLI